MSLCSLQSVTADTSSSWFGFLFHYITQISTEGFCYFFILFFFSSPLYFLLYLVIQNGGRLAGSSLLIAEDWREIFVGIWVCQRVLFSFKWKALSTSLKMYPPIWKCWDWIEGWTSHVSSEAKVWQIQHRKRNKDANERQIQGEQGNRLENFE